MSNDKDSTIKKWLDNLQQESWQLELIVSGFAIFLLLGLGDVLEGMDYKISHLELGVSMYALFGLPLMVLKGGWLIMLINLITHVFLRGLWISTIGLRYVSQDIDLDGLNFQPRFDAFLRRRMKSFDHYIETLEKLCSVIFAFTFLLVFMAFSFGLFLFILVSILAGMQKGLGVDNDRYQTINDSINLFFGVSSLIYAIDFIGLGWLKRKKWIAFWYYPIYRLMGFMTAARLYRPLYYNLIDNKFGRRMGYFLVPYMILLMVTSSVNLVTDTYYPGKIPAKYASLAYYDSERTMEEYTSISSIPDKYVRDGFLEIFVPYHPDSDDLAIEEYYPDLTEAQHTGLKLKGVINTGSVNNKTANVDSLLMCLSSIHRIYINDSLFIEPKAYFYTHPLRKDEGLKYIVDVAYLNRGKHELKVEKYKSRSIFGQRLEELEWRTQCVIPFWVIE